MSDVSTTDSADSTANETPSPSQPDKALNYYDLRSEPRILVRWHADALVDGHGVYHGFVKDISLKGTNIYLDLNLQKVESIKLRIHLPPISTTCEHHFIEVAGRVVYTSYDGNESLFHAGVQFTHFTLKSDQAYLKSRIDAFNHVGSAT
jgi:hypothetical protein